MTCSGAASSTPSTRTTVHSALDRVSNRERTSTAYALYYPPSNRDFVGAEGERPPLIVESHGGPTSMTSAQLNLESSSGPAADSAWSTSTTAAAPATAVPTASAERPAGASSTSTTASTRALPGRARRGRRPAAGDPRRQRGRLHDALRARLPRRLRGRREPLRRGRLRGAGDRHPQVRVALPRRPDRPVARRRSDVYSSARRSTSPTGCRVR